MATLPRDQADIEALQHLLGSDPNPPEVDSPQGRCLDMHGVSHCQPPGDHQACGLQAAARCGGELIELHLQRRGVVQNLREIPI